MKTSWINFILGGFMFGFALSIDSWGWWIACLLGMVNIIMGFVLELE